MVFEINSSTGLIRVRNDKNLDFETNPKIRLVVVAQADGNQPLYGYCDVNIHLTDQNDNMPRFTQQEYSAAVWEGNNKGTFVIQVSFLLS